MPARYKKANPVKGVALPGTGKTRVVFFAAQLYALVCGRETGFGGAETEMWNVARGLAADPDFDVRAVTLTDEITCPRVFGNLTIHPAPPPPDISYNDSWLRRRRAILRYYYMLYKVLRSQDAQVYFTKLASAEACIVWLASRLGGKNYVFRVEHDWETNLTDLTEKIFRGKKAYAKIFVFCLLRADLVVVQTKAQAKALQENFGVSSELIPNAHLLPSQDNVETSPEKRDAVLWVGRAHPMKRPALFLDIVGHFQDKQFVMIMAPGSEHPELTSQVRQRALNLSNLEFIPGIAADKIDRFYQSARLFILTSEAEGFSNVIIEAMKNGCPVLTLDHNPNSILDEPSTLEKLTPAPGYCVRNRMDLAKALTAKLLRDNNFWTSCHSGLRTLVERNFGIEHIISIYKQRFDTLAEGRK